VEDVRVTVEAASAMAQIMTGLLIAALLEARWISGRLEKPAVPLGGRGAAMLLISPALLVSALAICIKAVVNGQQVGSLGRVVTVIAVACSFLSLLLGPYLQLWDSLAEKLMFPGGRAAPDRVGGFLRWRVHDESDHGVQFFPRSIFMLVLLLPWLAAGAVTVWVAIAMIIS
jgi:hypothetical protein